MGIRAQRAANSWRELCLGRCWPAVGSSPEGRVEQLRTVVLTLNPPCSAPWGPHGRELGQGGHSGSQQDPLWVGAGGTGESLVCLSLLQAVTPWRSPFA